MQVSSMSRCILKCLFTLLCFSLFAQVTAQTQSPPPASQTVSYSLSAGNTTITSQTVSRAHTSTFTTVVPTTYNVSVTVPVTAAAASSSGPAPIVLETKVDPGFGVLGALLILTGIPSAFFGHKNRWTSFFLIGFYTMSLVCFVLILKFGILPAIHPPSETLRGLFVLSCAIAGAIGGAVSIFSWKGTRYFIGGWGGFVFGLFIQCMHTGGLVKPIGLRWLMFIGCGVVGFCLCAIPKIHHHIILISTAFVGATSIMLGADCFSTAGLKEFYMWNIGFNALFPKFTDNGIEFPISQTMQIELGLMGAISIMGIAVQLRILKILQRKLEEIAAEQQRIENELDAENAGRFTEIDLEKQEWEKKHGRTNSDFSSLMKGRDSTSTPLPLYTSPDPEGRPRYASGTSSMLLAGGNPPRSQSPGVIPALDFGTEIQTDVPRDYLANEPGPSSRPLTADDDLNHKEKLLSDIQNIRRSIEVLKTEGSSTIASHSRHRSNSQDLNSIALYRAGGSSGNGTRSRIPSMEMSELVRDRSGSTINRPGSVPIQDDWDSYVQERKLLQPPSGTTAPIATSLAPPPQRLSLSPAVLDAVTQRQQRENLLSSATDRHSRGSSSPLGASSSQDDVPLRQPAAAHTRTKSTGVTILPPKTYKEPAGSQPQRSPRVATYEELSRRHQEKIRELQAPLTKAEKEQAEISAAKQRWERSKNLEKQAVTQRQADEAAAFEKKQKAGEEPDRPQYRSRTLSGDRLAAMNTNSKRASTMKVEDWQKHQQDFDGEPSGGRRSRALSPSGVPFPRPQEGRNRSTPRDPPR